MISVLIDTNFLIYSFDKKNDLRRIFDESVTDSYALITLDKCIGELNRLKRKDVIYWCKLVGIKILSSPPYGKTDFILIEVAKKYGYYLLSSDRALLQQAKSKSIKTLSVGGRGIKFSTN